MAESECVLRQKTWKPGEAFEFPQGTKEDFDDEDQKIYDRIRKYAKDWLRKEDTAILLPIGIKEHIDHIILREAMVDTVHEIYPECAASIYFGEDQPYTGLAFSEDMKKADEFIKAHSLVPLDYQINESRKVDLVMRFYPTQVEESYQTGILSRSSQLKEQYRSDQGIERIYRWERG
jgi:hypothetical protein